MEQLAYYEWNVKFSEYFKATKEISKAVNIPFYKDVISEQYKMEKEAEHYHNDIYDVRLYKNLWQMPYANFKKYTDLVGDSMIWLSIKRKDKEPCRDWRDFMSIKNQLVGEEHEAVELFPKQSRVVDTANQYHLWCFKDESGFFPFGFTHGSLNDVATNTSLGKSKQRQFNEGAK